MANALYICYFGIREPLVQTQVLPYLREVLKDGHAVSLLTFEPLAGDGETGRREDDDIRAELAGEGIDWYWLRYHKRPSAVATAYDIFRGAWFIRGMIRRKNLDLLHGRVHVPTLMGAIARKFSRRKPKLLFDIRGFFPEEYTDAGIWPEDGWLYRSAKRAEKWLMQEADGFVVLTEKARSILFPESKETGRDSFGRPVEVIPCCVDLERFESANEETRREMRERLGVGGRFVMAYVGSFGGWYLTDETADVFGVLKERDPDAFALILTQSPRSVIEPLLRERGYSDADMFIAKVPPDQIPLHLSAADAAVSFIKPCYSKQASSPTKNAEYLACGLPIIANSGVGDVDDLIVRNGVGALVRDLSPDGYRDALERVSELGSTMELLRETARREFGQKLVGGERYRRLYRRLLSEGEDKD